MQTGQETYHMPGKPPNILGHSSEAAAAGKLPIHAIMSFRQPTWAIACISLPVTPAKIVCHLSTISCLFRHNRLFCKCAATLAVQKPPLHNAMIRKCRRKIRSARLQQNHKWMSVIICWRQETDSLCIRLQNMFQKCKRVEAAGSCNN